MNIQEFRSRTAKFLPEDEIARYGEAYEPAYMAARYVDKDDFCAVLKDERVRRIVTGLSATLTSLYGQIKDERRESASLRRKLGETASQHGEAMAVAEGAAEALRKQLSVIQSLCDRALAAG